MEGTLGQSQSKSPSWSSGATCEFNPKKWEWISQKTNLNSLLPSGKSTLPLLRLREPLNHKARFWDGEGILQQSRTVLISRNVTFSVPKLPGALTAAPTTEQRAWNIQLDQTQLSQHKHISQPKAWISISHKHTVPSPITLQKGKWVIQTRLRWTLSAGEWIQAWAISFSVKQFVPSVFGLFFVLVGFNQTNLSNPHFVGTAGGGSSGEQQILKTVLERNRR